MFQRSILTWAVLTIALGVAWTATAQPLGKPDTGQPGDGMIQKYLLQETIRLHREFDDDLSSIKLWQERLPRYRQEYLYMLGLWPLPEKTPLQAQVTGTLEEPGFFVDKLHYQSRPGLYVTANLYRPAKVEPGQKLPAVLYVCGHSRMGRDGNKTAYQAHGIWLAKHGYICLTVDTLQLGEIAAIHHGTYQEQRWWWHSRGYTSAGVECWNGIRGLDYLLTRDDVDPDRLAVTGISGGGAATFWVAAADERVKVAVPISGMADLAAYVPNRVINGHCDCMFLYNTYQWPWVRIAGLIAPRPLLFINSDHDQIFPMDANRRVINQLEDLYSLYGAGDHVDAVVSVGGHAYRQDIRQATYRFLNAWLKDDARVVADSENDLVINESNASRQFPIAPERLRVFATDADLPGDELNTTIDRHFVPLAQVSLPTSTSEFAGWSQGLKTQLREVSFRTLPENVPSGELVQEGPDGTQVLVTEPGIQIVLHAPAGGTTANEKDRVLLVVQGEAANMDWLKDVQRPTDVVYVVDPRGIGATAWTRRNPPNYVERSHVLLGRTVANGRVWDIISTVKYLRRKHGDKLPIAVAGAEGEGLLAAYAALWEPLVGEVIAVAPPASHMEMQAPAFLNVLRVCDVPHILGMLAPRQVSLGSDNEHLLQTVKTLYQTADHAEALSTKSAPTATPKAN